MSVYFVSLLKILIGSNRHTSQTFANFNLLPLFNSGADPGHESGSIDEPVQVQPQNKESQRHGDAEEQQHYVSPKVNATLRLHHIAV